MALAVHPGRSAGQAPQADDLACTNWALSRAARRLTQIYDDALASVDLTSAQARLLSEVSDAMAEGSPEGPTLQALARRLSIQVSALPLARDGRVEVRGDARDRRAKHAILTQAGDARLGEMLVIWRGVHDRVERAMGPDAALLRALADRVASPDFLEANAGGGSANRQATRRGNLDPLVTTSVAGQTSL